MNELFMLAAREIASKYRCESVYLEEDQAEYTAEIISDFVAQKMQNLQALAHWQPDDAEPITREWVESQWPMSGGTSQLWSFRLPKDGTGRKMWLCATSDFSNVSIDIDAGDDVDFSIPVHTRGEVRRALAVLGVEVKT